MMIREEYSNIGRVDPFAGMNACKLRQFSAGQITQTPPSTPPTAPIYPRN
jgi:hypothetical protein